MDGASIGERIRLTREEKGLSQAALAAKLGVTGGAIWGWETGRHAIREVYLAPLAEALGVPISTLAPGHPEPDAAAPAPTTGLGEALLQTLEAAIDINVLSPGEVIARVRNRVTRASSEGYPAPTDLITQAEAAATLGVSRQAVHRLVAEGRVKGYPNPDRPDRAPMVSLAAVRTLVRSRPEPEPVKTGGAATADRPPTNEKDQNEDLTQVPRVTTQNRE